MRSWEKELKKHGVWGGALAITELHKWSKFPSCTTSCSLSMDAYQAVLSHATFLQMRNLENQSSKSHIGLEPREVNWGTRPWILIPPCYNAWTRLCIPAKKQADLSKPWNILLAHLQWWCATPARKIYDDCFLVIWQQMMKEERTVFYLWKDWTMSHLPKCSVNLKILILSHQPSLLSRAYKRRFMWNPLLHGWPYILTIQKINNRTPSY